MQRTFLILILIIIPMIPSQADDATSDFDLLSVENADSIIEVDRFGDGDFTSQGSWSPDGTLFAIPGSLGIWLFNKDNVESPDLLAQDTGVNDITWSPNGTRLAGASESSTQIWDVDTRTIVELYDGATQIMYSPNGDYLVLTKAVNYGNTGLDSSPLFEVINLASGEVVGRIVGDGYSYGYANFSLDGSYLLTQSLCYLPQYCEYVSTFQIWRMDSPLPMDGVGDAFLSPHDELSIIGRSPIMLEGERVAYIGYGDGTQWITIRDLATHEERTIDIDASSYPRLVPYSSDELIEVEVSYAGQHELRFINTESGVVTRTHDAGTFFYFHVSPDNQFLIAHDGKQVNLFALTDESLSEIATFHFQHPVLSDIPATVTPVESQGISCIQLENAVPSTSCGAFNSDNSQFVGRSELVDIYLWDTETRQGEFLREVEPNDMADDFVFSQEDTFLVFQISDCLINSRCLYSVIYGYSLSDNPSLEYEITSPVVVQMLFGENDASNLLAVLTIDGMNLINSDDGTTLTSLPTVSSPVLQVAFSSDGYFLVTRHSDDTIRVWGVPSEES
ncbi:MAG: WD40 repeat domain-containing protein [Aggregatilineales bacterium]